MATERTPITPNWTQAIDTPGTFLLQAQSSGDVFVAVAASTPTETPANVPHITLVAGGTERITIASGQRAYVIGQHGGYLAATPYAVAQQQGGGGTADGVVSGVDLALTGQQLSLTLTRTIGASLTDSVNLPDAGGGDSAGPGAIEQDGTTTFTVPGTRRTFAAPDTPLAYPSGTHWIIIEFSDLAGAHEAHWLDLDVINNLNAVIAGTAISTSNSIILPDTGSTGAVDVYIGRSATNQVMFASSATTGTVTFQLYHVVPGDTAAGVSVTATGFSGNLSATDTDVQTAMETIDGLDVPSDGDIDGRASARVLSLVRAQALVGNATRWAKDKLPTDTVYTNTQRFTAALLTKLNGIEENAKDDQSAAEVAVTASGFDGNLSSTDTDVQTALATIDGLELGGGGTAAAPVVTTFTVSPAAETTSQRAARGANPMSTLSWVITGNPTLITIAASNEADSPYIELEQVGDTYSSITNTSTWYDTGIPIPETGLLYIDAGDAHNINRFPRLFRAEELRELHAPNSNNIMMNTNVSLSRTAANNLSIRRQGGGGWNVRMYRLRTFAPTGKVDLSHPLATDTAMTPTPTEDVTWTLTASNSAGRVTSTAMYDFTAQALAFAEANSTWFGRGRDQRDYDYYGPRSVDITVDGTPLNVLQVRKHSRNGYTDVVIQRRSGDSTTNVGAAMRGKWVVLKTSGTERGRTNTPTSSGESSVTYHFDYRDWARWSSVPVRVEIWAQEPPAASG